MDLIPPLPGPHHQEDQAGPNGDQLLHPPDGSILGQQHQNGGPQHGGLEQGEDLGLPPQEQDNKSSERFYCPYPGCNRSFAELWRLKVHYRAPPDIRGSGKERGHGTELTHCPKCRKQLKPGKHHVGCTGSRSTPRQAKRKATDDGTGPGPFKPYRAGELLGAGYWHPGMDPAAAAAAAAGSGMEPYAAMTSLLANGAVPGVLLPPYPGSEPVFWPNPAYHAQPPGQHAAAAAVAAAAAAAAAYPYPPPGYPGHVQHPPHHPGAPPPGYPGYPPAPNGGPPMPMPFPPPGYPQGGPHPLPPGMPAPAPGQPPVPAQAHLPAPSSVHQQPSGSTGQAPSTGGSLQNSTPATSGLESSEPEFLAGIFDDLPDFNRVVPSPPPLPEDFHMHSQTPNRLLFNFSQFSHKMPQSLHEVHATRELTDKEALDLAEQHVVYDHTDDGELMQMLFGMADDMPTMATIHLHAWHNVDMEEAEAAGLLQQQGMMPPGQGHAGATTSSQQQAQGMTNAALPSGGGPASLSTQPAATTAHHAASNGRQLEHRGGGSSVVPVVKQEAGQQHQDTTKAGGQMDGLLDQDHAPLSGSSIGLAELGADDKSLPGDLAAGSGQAQKHHMDVLVNCGDDRDHMLEAEMHQFLQSVE